MDCCKQPIHRFAKEGLEKRETYQEKEQVSSDLDVILTAQRFSPAATMHHPGLCVHRSTHGVRALQEQGYLEVRGCHYEA